MPRMIEMMRQSAVPSHIMRSAAKGALAVPPDEMIEILVYLTTNPVFRADAELTLAGWDENSCLAAASNPDSPPEVLAYFTDHLRAALLPALLENSAVPDSRLAEVAASATRDTLLLMLTSARVSWSPEILNALLSNSHLAPDEARQVRALLREIEPLLEYEREHAAEIAAESSKPFHLVGGTEEENQALAEARDLHFLKPTVPFVLPPMAEAGAPAPDHAAAAAPALAQQAEPQPAEREHISTLQKIARLKVGERVQLAMKGNKDERFILVRDGAKVVAQAVLESPKLTDTEAEMFAGMKNVQEVVLRALAGKRKFARNYRIQRNLAFNPKCPIDVSLHLCNNLMIGDLKALSMNKEVPETVKKQALRLFVQKNDTRKGHSGS